MKKRIKNLIKIIIIITSFCIAIIFTLYWNPVSEDYDKGLRIIIGETEFYLNETGIVYNNTFYYYDEIFVKKSCDKI